MIPVTGEERSLEFETELPVNSQSTQERQIGTLVDFEANPSDPSACPKGKKVGRKTARKAPQM